MINKLIAMILLCGAAILLLGSIFYIFLCSKNKKSISDIAIFVIALAVLLAVFALYMFCKLIQ